MEICLNFWLVSKHKINGRIFFIWWSTHKKPVPNIKVNSELLKRLPLSPLRSGIDKDVWLHKFYWDQNYTGSQVQTANSKKEKGKSDKN